MTKADLKYWAMAVCGDLFLLYAMWAWLVNGSEGAGNVSLFILWTIAVARLLSGFLGDKTWFKSERPRGFQPYHFVTDLAVVMVLAYFGMFALAACFLFSHGAGEAARSREPKANKEAA